MDDFDAIAAQLRREARWEHEGEAREIVAADDAQRSLLEELRRVPVGEAVAVVTVDGAAVNGRVVGVGADWIRVAEVADTVGTRRARARRIHLIPLSSVVRVSRGVA
ncbi:MAG TPA: hypothetical protein VIC35_10665 [Acidimicrobiia bacterium]|jgi:hypothetical protein